MIDWLAEHYLWLKALHVMSVMAWLAGLFYLPRLFVYHADPDLPAATSALFKVMERRLLRQIMNPAMIAAWTFGALMLVSGGVDLDATWLHAKLVLVVIMTVFHHSLAKWRKDFLNDANRRSARFYRIANEAPTALMVAIVILAVVEPF